MPAGFYEGKPNDYGVKEGGEAIQKTVAAIGGIFQERYQQKQYNDFINGPQKDYEDKLHAASDLLLDETNDEGPSQAIKMMSGALSTYMDEAGRYKNNPLIADRAHQAFTGNNLMLQQLFTNRFNQQKLDMQQNKQDTADIESQARVDETKARTGLLNAQSEGLKNGSLVTGPTGRIGKAPATKGGKGGPAFLTGGPGMIDPSLPAEDQVRQAYSIASGNLTNPGSSAAQKAQEAEISAVRHSMGQQKVVDLQAHGEMRQWNDPKNGPQSEPWDASNKAHIDEAAETLVDPEDARNAYLLSKIKEEAPSTMPGVTGDIIEKQLGWMKDPNLANPNAPVLREMSEPNVGKVLLGSEGWSRMSRTIVDPKTKAESKKAPIDLTEAAHNLPETYDAIEGPMRSAIDTTMGAIVSGTYKPQNADEVRQLMEVSLLAVVGQYIGGGHPNAKVNEGVKKSRYAAANFAKAIAAKYAAEVAAKAGVGPKQAQKEDGEGFLHMTNEALSKYTPLGKLEEHASDAYEGAKGLLNKIQE